MNAVMPCLIAYLILREHSRGHPLLLGPKDSIRGRWTKAAVRSSEAKIHRRILIFHKCDLHHLTSIGAVNTLRAIELTN